jgi:hypothetical protein
MHAKTQENPMNPALALILIYIFVAAIFQFVGFLISQAVNLAQPSFGLVTLLCLFLASYLFAWPVAVRITEAIVPGAKSDA